MGHEYHHYGLREKLKAALKKIFDWFPLPVLYIVNGAALLGWALDMTPWFNLPPANPLWILDELLLTIAVYYYEVYLLKRTYGVINPMRILKGQTPLAKKKIGILPYEQSMDSIRGRVKAMAQAAKRSEIPGLVPDKIKRLAAEVAAIEKRLQTLDRTLASPPFRERPIRAEIDRLNSLIAASADETINQDLKEAIDHANAHIDNINRLCDERNRLVAKLDRFRLQLDETWSRLMALSGAPAKPETADRLLNELFDSVKNFDDSLTEIEQKPAPEIMQKTIAEIEQAEARAQGKIPPRQTTGAK
jgi:hypothetical protein